MDCSTVCFPVHHQLSEFAQTHVTRVGDAIQPSHPPLSPSTAFSLSHSFSDESALWIMWHLRAVQRTLKTLLQHCSFKASVFRLPTLFMVQLSHPYITTVKTIALTIWTFFGRVMCLLFNMLPRFIIAFLPRSKLGKTYCWLSFIPRIMHIKSSFCIWLSLNKRLRLKIWVQLSIMNFSLVKMWNHHNKQHWFIFLF